MNNTGWICPRCGQVYAPWVPQCNCTSTQDNDISVNTDGTGNMNTYSDIQLQENIDAGQNAEDIPSFGFIYAAYDSKEYMEYLCKNCMLRKVSCDSKKCEKWKELRDAFIAGENKYKCRIENAVKKSKAK